MSSLLLDVGVPFRVDRDGTLYLEAQAHHGVRCWLDNFDRLTLCACVVPESNIDKTMQWLPAADLLAQGRLSVELLPWSYAVADHFRHVGAVRKRLRSLIAEHSHLCFSTLGWLGAWGSIGCEEAHKLNRTFAVWLDWVLHRMPMAPAGNPVKRLWRRVQREMVRRRSVRDIGRATLGLFNGRTVFDAYERYCKVPKVVHDIHLGESDIISEPRLQQRLARHDGAINVIYVGRVHEMKGPRYWVDALEIAVKALQQAGRRPIKATWYGDGPLLEELRRTVETRDLSAAIRFAGPVTDHARLIQMLQEADLFVFCHLTPESPRCLIESLMCGVPIVGFESTYASDLLNGHSEGGAFVPIADASALAQAVVDCLAEPDKLSTMSLAARAAGAGFTDTLVFSHRSDLIKQFS